MFHFVHVDPLPRDELTEVLVGLYPELEGSEPLEQIVGLKDRLDVAVRGGAADTVDGREGLTLSLRKIGHVCRRVVERRRRGWTVGICRVLFTTR